MTDEEMLDRFARVALEAGAFHHADHVRLTWLLLKRHSLLEAIARLTQGLRAFAESAGALDRYHETITWAYAVLINERMQCRPADDFAEFARRNEDVVDWHGAGLKQLYSQDRLGSALARNMFLLPDGGGAAI